MTDKITSHSTNLTFALLAGGQGRRVGYQNKGLIQWQERPLIRYALDWLTNETASLNGEVEILLVTNDRMEDYQALLTEYPHPVKLISDRQPGFLGPLAGMDTAFAHTDADWIQCLPCDNPKIPPGLVARLAQFQNQSSIIMPKDASRVQPLFAQIHRSVWPKLVEALAANHLAVYKWMQTQDSYIADVSDLTPSFENFNTLSLLNPLPNQERK